MHASHTTFGRGEEQKGLVWLIRGRYERCKVANRFQADLEQEDDYQRALVVATRLNQAEIVELLVDANANIHHRDQWGGTPLVRAI